LSDKQENRKIIGKGKKELTEEQKNVVKTIGDLRKSLSISDGKDKQIMEVLDVITNRRKEKVTVRYEDIGEEITFIIKPLTVKTEMELSMFKTKMERDRHMISRLVTTEEGRPITYAEVDMMPLGMMRVLVSAIENVSFLQNVETEQLKS